MLSDRKNQVLLLLGFIIAVLTLIRSVQIIDLYFQGLDYAVYQEELDEEKRINLLLTEQLLSISNLGYLEQKAKQSGFVQATYIYLNTH